MGYNSADFKEVSVNLTEYLRILVRRGWIMVLLAVIVGGSAYLLAREQDPVYRATQNVVIQPSRTDLGLAEASRSLLEPLVVIIDSQEVAQQIIQNLRLDMQPGQLKSDVTIASDRFRMTIQIDVDNGDPQVASQVARAWGQVLVDYRAEENAKVRREDRVNAIMPDQPVVGQQAPRPRILGVAGAIFGLLIGGVIVFVLEFMESSVIRQREDLDMPVLAVIPGRSDHA